MKPSQTLFALLTVLMAIFATGCAEDKMSGDGHVGKASVALQSPAGDCVTGTIQIRNSSNAIVSSIATDCTDASQEVILQPGDYTIGMASGYTCNPAGTPDTGYVDCTYLTSNPSPFHVSVGVRTQVSLNFQFNYENRNVAVVFGVGSVDLTLGDAGVQNLCGSGTSARTCTTDEVCAVLDNVTPPRCYTKCGTTGIACATGQVCIPVATQIATTSTDPTLVLVSIGSQANLQTILHLCAPGTSGAGGASGTGGSSNVAGSSATGGSSTNGGTSGVAGSSSVVGGASSTGGVTAAGGTTASGGTTAQPGMTCSAAGVTVSCTITNCAQAAIICTDSGNGLVWGGCVCLSSGTGGASSTGGTSSVGGTSATGGVTAAGGTTATGGTFGTAGSTGTPFPVACTAGQQVIRFDANNIVVGPGHDVPFPGSNAIRFEGMRVSLGTWGALCSDLDSSNFSFTCVTSWVSGLWEFQMYMPMAGAYGNEIYWGDRNYYGPGCPAQWGGNGSTLGTLTVAPCLDQTHPYTISLVGNLTWRDPNVATHCEANEMLSYNGQVLIP